MNNTSQHEQSSAIPATIPDSPPVRVRERKIGKATFIVSSSFNSGKEKDIVSTMARLIQYNNDN